MILYSDLRKFPRKLFERQVVLLLDGDQDRVLHGSTVDVSEEGVKVRVEGDRFKVGDCVGLLIDGGQGPADCVAVWVRSEPMETEAGLQFIDYCQSLLESC